MKKPYDFDLLDYSKMMFDVYHVKQGEDLCHRFPRIAVHHEFQGYGQRDRNRLIRFVMYAYDVHSPFLELRNILDRHNRCMDLAGIKNKDTRQMILDGEHEGINAMIFCYLTKVQNSRKFQLYISLEKAYQAMVENIYAPIKQSDKGSQKALQDAYKLKYDNSTNALEMAEKLEELEKELFPHFDEVRGMVTSDKYTEELFAGAAETLAELVQHESN